MRRRCLDRLIGWRLVEGCRPALACAPHALGLARRAHLTFPQPRVRCERIAASSTGGASDLLQLAAQFSQLPDAGRRVRRIAIRDSGVA